MQEHERIDGALQKSAAISSLWKYLPLPDEPDMHEEHDSRSGLTPEGFAIIGARVRGKKHKHEGTHCDDWFEFSTAGVWTVFALSDGAGSKKFSRVGARVACQESAQFLADALRNHTLCERDTWTADTFSRDEQTGVFEEADLQVVQIALHGALEHAYQSVVAAADERRSSEAHMKFLGGREPTVFDFSGTLLVAVHTSLIYKEQCYSFILACQIGDGATAVIDKDGNLVLLGVPDSGDFSGETDFLTSREKLDPSSLMSRTVPYFGPLRILLTMSDGVSDDYFPHSPGVLRLYGDLILNDIVWPGRVEGERRAEHPTQAPVPADEETDKVEYQSRVEVATSWGVEERFIKSCEKYREILGTTLELLVKDTSLLAAGRKHKPGEIEGAEKLRYWLESYQVRGSFDDRTLLLLYR